MDPAALSQAEIPRAKGMLRMMNVSATGDATNCGRKQVHLDKLWASAEAGPPRKKRKEQELGLSSAAAPTAGVVDLSKGAELL